MPYTDKISKILIMTAKFIRVDDAMPSALPYLFLNKKKRTHTL